MGNGNVHYWIGKDACQGRAFIQSLEGSITVTLHSVPGSAVKPFIAYVAMNGEDTPVSDCCKLDDSTDCESNLFQDGPMGRASTTLIRQPDSDILILAAEGFYSFQAYYGGWLSVNFLSLQVNGVHIILNAPSGQATVDLEDYFSSSVFSGVPMEWSYDEGHKLNNSLAEYVDNGFNLVDIIDALEADEVPLPDPHADGKQEKDENAQPRVENVVLVDPETNNVIRLKDEWDTETEEAAEPGYGTFTLDEQTLLIQGNDPEEEQTNTEGPGVGKRDG